MGRAGLTPALRAALWGGLLAAALTLAAGSTVAREPPARPDIVLILADDLGFSDVGCYGSEIATPNLDRLAASGLRFTRFHNAARCCPTRASLLTGLYPHQAGVGHMLGNLRPPAYTSGLNDRCAGVPELLAQRGYRNYHAGKWHVGGAADPTSPNFPLRRGFHRTYHTAGGGNYFAPRPLFLDAKPVEPAGDYYITDAITDSAVRFLEEHGKRQPDRPYFLNLCYTAPHFPLHARPEDVERYRGRYRDGWDRLRERRFARQRELGVIDRRWRLSARDPVAAPWESAGDREEWDLRMAVHAAMIDRMDRGIGRVLDTVRAMGRERNTLVLFLSDNGASAEALDSWPNPARGHRPGSVTGTRESHRCIEIGWANAANTPFRENKMWIHQGGIATPLIARWPRGIRRRPGSLTHQVGHVIDLAPTLLEAAGVTYPDSLGERRLLPLEGLSLLPVFRGGLLPARTLAWEHEGNRGLRRGDWKLVAPHLGPWELYDMAADGTETTDMAARRPERVRELAAEWQAWADRVGVVPWSELPGSGYRPTAGYRKKSEPAP